jgi:serine/threonine protein kinase
VTRAFRELGTVVAGRYRVDAMIGEGGMGVVARAHDLQLKREVAIKLMRPALALQSPQLATRFEIEAQSVARLEHPNIVQVIDFGSTSDGGKFLVMQLLVGASLQSLLGTPMSPQRAVALALPILRGLAHAHTRGVVHRDIKPENVLVTRDHEGAEQLKLVDFGLAKLLDAEPGAPALTHAGLVMGTPSYMSPEQAMGKPVDARGDLYAVGLLLHEMLRGRPTFDNENPMGMVVMQATEAPPPLPDDVPPALAAVVMRLLAKAPDDRFASAEETIAALEGANAAPEATPPPPAVAPVRRKRVRRRSRHSSVFVRPPLLIASVLAAIVVAWIFWPDGDPSHRFDRLVDAVARLLTSF